MRKKKEIKLEWYVLNSVYCRPDKEEFDTYPYSFHYTNIRPWNVFNNWPFRDAAIQLAKDYKNRKIDKYNWLNDFPKDGTDYEKFKFSLIHELQHEEWSRCEYEIQVAEWPERKDHGNVLMDKIDSYSQVLPNADIFAKYVLMTVNGSLLQKESKQK